MSPIRLLIIGRPATEWAERLGRNAGPELEIDCARLPSAGIRQFESTPADLLIVADDQGGARVETLVHAIRKRPLGQLVPLLLLCPLPADEPVANKVAALDLVDWLALETTPERVLSIIENALEVDLSTRASAAGSSHAASSPVAPAPTIPEESDETGSASYFDGSVVLEPLDAPVDAPQTRQLSRNQIFRSTSLGPQSGPVGADEIKRKLKAVRHEDYYAILELRRGAEGQSVREAFHRLKARFDSRSLDFELVHRFQDDLDEIADAIEDAFAVLGDPELRAAYLRHTVK